MTLNIRESLRTDGVRGVSGSDGANGTASVRSGGSGGAGASGANVVLQLQGQNWIGDSGGDVVSFERQAVGGAGGSGGNGGTGAGATATVTTTSAPQSFLQEAVYDAPGSGGGAGGGGAGGLATVDYRLLTADFGAAVGTQDTLRLNGIAWGGNGSSGGGSGGGGSSGYSGNSQAITTGPPPFSSVNSQLGTPGGTAPDGGDAGDGAIARALFRDIAVIGETVAIGIFGAGHGGSGGQGGPGASGGSGSTGAPGGNGSDGGDGATGLAQVDGLSVDVTAGLQLTIVLDARGGQGANGGGGGASGSGRRIDSITTDSVGGSLDTTIYAGNGRGGDGGDGGDAIARILDSTIIGGSVADNVLLYLTATGGLSGVGGGGLAGVASSSVTSGTDIVSTSIVQGVPAGQRGADGSPGAGVVIIENTRIELAGGDDRLTFDLLAAGPGGGRVRVSGNTFDGGIGQDRLSLGDGTPGEPAALVNVRDGLLRLGASPVLNVMTGFEEFVGTSGNDVFIDGTGNQTYSGGTGADQFRFIRTQPGQDSIRDFTAEDDIRLFGFGTSLDSFTKILAATADTSGGAQIALGGGSSLLLASFAKATLTADMFF